MRDADHIHLHQNRVALHGHSTRRHPVLRAVLAALLVLSVLGVLEASQGAPAGATVPPVVEPGPGVVTADVLPTVQINGVVWAQTIVGNTVYAVGEFTQARPAGSPAGVNETPRSNILAYNLTTGQLNTAFTASLNRQGRAITASPDGSRIYVGGDFTQVNGIGRSRIVALDPTTGAVITSFNAPVDYVVRALVATDTTLYAGGSFNYSSGNSRSRLAAFSASNGALLAWAPAADNTVHTMVRSPNGASIFAGGRFTTINGQAAYGMAKIDAVTGQLQPWPVNTLIRNAQNQAAINTLITDGVSIFGGGYTYGRQTGNFEGTFSANPDTGEIRWIEDCHGDTYSTWAMNGYMYKASHTHYCGNVGGFWQSRDWADNMSHSTVFKDEVGGTVRREAWNYFNWEGRPAPKLVNWFPKWVIGSYTGLNQATWSVTGNGTYAVYGGEFLGVNNVDQQGLVRFAVRGVAPGQSAPRLQGPDFPIKLQSTAPGQVRISFNANWDRDNLELNYSITRDGATVYQTRAASTFWDQPIIGFTDTGLTPGQTYTYRVSVSDDDGNTRSSDPTPVTIAASGAPSPYADLVMADGARMHWRLDDPPGSTTVNDAVGFENASISNATLGASGPLLTEPSQAATFASNQSSTMSNPNELTFQQTFSEEIWFRTSSLSGGRLMGFSSSRTGTSTNYDRVLYLTSTGRVEFGARFRNGSFGPGAPYQRYTVVSPQIGLNNNQWHHVVGTVGPDGMHLYVDGVQVASRGDVMGGEAFYGYWRVGADTLSGWADRPLTDYLAGTLAEPAVYYGVLTPAQIANHYAASGRTPGVQPTPADAYGAAIHNADPYLYYRLAEPSGTVAVDSGIRANTGDYVGSVTHGQPGVIAGNNAAQFSAGGGFVASRTGIYSPENYSLEAWFNTTTTGGGTIVGFGNSRSGDSTTSDRHVYMRDDGKLVFGVLAGVFNPTPVTIVTSQPYNNGAWHHVVATQGTDGMLLYVDGVLAGTNPQTVSRAYTGYWKIGRDTAAAGATNPGFAGRIDEVAVYDRVLTASDVTNHFTLAGGVVPNVPPTASFTVGQNFLAVSVDGTASSDGDGTIASYAWNFGDGGTATGSTANHTYAAAGTYTITLTVTDNDGGTDTETHQVTVAANAAPTAAFTTSTTGLQVSVNGSSSNDTDGTITSYAWNFGDGGTATGSTANHTYAAAGTYTITLTVTDDQSATGTTTQQVTVSGAMAADAFGRTVVNGWGSADVGGSWTLGGTASNFAVNGGAGRITIPGAGVSRSATLGSLSALDVDATVDMALDKAPTGGGTYLDLTARKVGTTEYRLRVRVTPTTTYLQLIRVVSNAETTIASQTLSGVIYTAGSVAHLRLRVEGSGTTLLQGKVWFDGAAEPGTWQVQANDTTAALQNPGGVGVRGYLSGSSTNAPHVLSVDNLVVLPA